MFICLHYPHLIRNSEITVPLESCKLCRLLAINHEPKRELVISYRVLICSWGFVFGSPDLLVRKESSRSSIVKSTASDRHSVRFRHRSNENWLSLVDTDWPLDVGTLTLPIGLCSLPRSLLARQGRNVHESTIYKSPTEWRSSLTTLIRRKVVSLKS